MKKTRTLMTSITPASVSVPANLVVTNSISFGGKVLVLLSAQREQDLPAIGSTFRVAGGAGTWWVVVSYADRQADHHAGGYWAEVRVASGRPCSTADRGEVVAMQSMALAS